MKSNEEDGMKSKYVVAAAFLMALLPAAAQAQQRVQLPQTQKEYLMPFPGFKIVGNFYHVGTYDLSCYLIDTGAGLILINSGTPGTYPLIKANIEALGFKTSDIRTITATHAHWDHVADLASFKKDAPAATVYINEREAPVVEAGGNPDPRSGAYRIFFLPGSYSSLHGSTYDPTKVFYDPLKVDVKTKPGDHIKLGNTDMTVLQAYGHTPGANSFSFTVRDGGKEYNVYIVNMDVVNLMSDRVYPGIVEEVKNTLAQQAKYAPDIWVSSHAYMFNLHKIYKPGDPYNPSRFGDLSAYKAKIAGAQAAFDAQLAAQRAQKWNDRPNPY
jgi:metallo-beta-lactamase class B